MKDLWLSRLPAYGDKEFWHMALGFLKSQRDICRRFYGQEIPGTIFGAKLGGHTDRLDWISGVIIVELIKQLIKPNSIGIHGILPDGPRNLNQDSGFHKVKAREPSGI